MSDMLSAMVQFEAACSRIMALRTMLEEATAQRNAALTRLHESGVPKCHVGPIVRNYLLEEWKPEDVKALSLSDASIRLVLDRSGPKGSSPDPAPTVHHDPV